MKCLYKQILRRSLYAGVFLCLLSCDSQQEAKKGLAALDQSSTATNDISTEASPLLTLQELLSASDFREGIKRAYVASDREEMLYWQEQALLVAKEARLLQKDIELLSGEQGLLFLEFQAKKHLFNEEFAERFINFQETQTLFDKYPNLTSLHEKAEALILQRDQLLVKAIDVLKEDGFEGDADIEARQQWRAYMVNSGNVNLILGLPVSE